MYIVTPLLSPVFDSKNGGVSFNLIKKKKQKKELFIYLWTADESL